VLAEFKNKSYLKSIIGIEIAFLLTAADFTPKQTKRLPLP
jgi:hypothetical protein